MDDHRSTIRYCVRIGGYLVAWKRKKQDMVGRSLAEAEHRVMTLSLCEMI
jgi:type IV secretory pathway protease TraF